MFFYLLIIKYVRLTLRSMNLYGACLRMLEVIACLDSFLCLLISGIFSNK